MVIIYTRAYNAENTIRRTIESILNQTHEDFRYILFNNGSLDSTFDIMREYAARDKRIIILSRDNNMTSFNSTMGVLNFIVNNYTDEDFFCNIDADDVYDAHFFEHMVKFVKDNQLDVAFCGYNVLERGTDKLIEQKVLEKNLVMSNPELPQYFMQFRRYTTDMWAKLFRVSTLRFYLEKDRFELFKSRNHTQQCFIYDAILNSAKVGMLAETLMDYYVSNTAQQNMRIGGNVSLIQSRAIFDILNDFLKNFKQEEDLKVRNQSYVYAIYCGYLGDAVNVIKLTNAMSMSNKISYFFNIFTYYATKDMLCYKAADEFYSLRFSEKTKLCQSVIDYIYSMDNWAMEENKVALIIESMKDCGIDLKY